MSTLPGVTIVIPNYNMGLYVGAAIESALAQDHPTCEVVVVDDASNDCSREVIERYAGRIQMMFLEENGGQLAALQSGWPLARHPILIFLDSDDMLLPHAASTIARAWQPGTAKVQFLMASIDAGGRPLGHVSPKYPGRLDTATVRAELLRTGSAPSSPGSGNAYARWLLERVAEDGGLITPPGLRFWMDAILEFNAPFYGAVVTLLEPLVLYRMHDSNDSQQSVADLKRFWKTTQYLDYKLIYITWRCHAWGIPFDADAAAGRNLWYAENRMAATRLEESEGGWQALRLLAPSLRACFASPFLLHQRLARAAWLVLVAACPTDIAMRVIEARFVIRRRPRWIERLVGSSRIPSFRPY